MIQNQTSLEVHLYGASLGVSRLYGLNDNAKVYGIRFANLNPFRIGVIDIVIVLTFKFQDAMFILQIA